MKALIIVDMQNDFMPGGPLGVPEADQLIPVINSLMPKFELIISTQDWHPEGHVSFAASHPHKKVGDIIEVHGIEQALWPIHCVQNTKGAELTPGLHKELIHHHFFKGTERGVDSYSAFFDNEKNHSTGLGDFLKEKGVTDIYLAGVLLEYCVAYSAFDALDLGFNVYVIKDACRALTPESQAKALTAIAIIGGHTI